MLVFAVIAALILQAWTWRRLSRRVASATATRLSASVRYALWALLPLGVVLATFLGAVGVEEWWGVALLSEPVARAALPLTGVLLGLGGLGSLCFALRMVVRRA